LKLLGQPLVDYIQKLAPSELHPWQQMTKEQIDIYVEFFRAAAIRLPLHFANLSETIGTFTKVYPTATSEEPVDIPLLEILNFFGLYIKELNKAENTWQITFPEIIVDKMNFQHDRLPLWKHYMHSPIRALVTNKSGATLEELGKIMFITRMSQHMLPTPKSLPMKSLFPFLEASFVQDCRIPLLFSEDRFKKFPKVELKEKSSKNNKPAKSADEKKKKEMEKKAHSLVQINNFFSDPNQEKAITVNIKRWDIISTHLTSNTYYSPLEKSASDDLLIMLSKSEPPTTIDYQIGVQWKSGEQKIKEYTLASESFKSYMGKQKNIPLTLIIVGFHVEIENHERAQPVIYDGVKLAVRFDRCHDKTGKLDGTTKFAFSPEFVRKYDSVAKEKTCYVGNTKKFFEIPPQFEVIVLLEAGAKHLLLEDNYNLLLGRGSEGNGYRNLFKRAYSMNFHLKDDKDDIVLKKVKPDDKS